MKKAIAIAILALASMPAFAVSFATLQVHANERGDGPDRQATIDRVTKEATDNAEYACEHNMQKGEISAQVDETNVVKLFVDALPAGGFTVSVSVVTECNEVFKH
jgi:hypothetical protein